MAGRLYVVGTPVGNLEDITLRALRVLGEVAAIACEDTRQTVKLLNRYGLRKPLISYFQPQEGRRIPEIVGLLEEGKDVALVSDAGTPGISDPGFPLIREALKEGTPGRSHPGTLGRHGGPVRGGPADPSLPLRRLPAAQGDGSAEAPGVARRGEGHPDLLPAHAQDPRIPGGGRPGSWATGGSSWPGS
ncbi:MAG: SAM-dependent methyltransferase [Candidatus Moduliflexus flocculans]|nr:SAM-dependent methyltransferase [Candidatus Moduliflexus flocculans]